jgi:DNA-binding response OmpR family regulator/arylsulfatase A-like enzyme
VVLPRILVVDDDRQIVRAVRTNLQVRGYEVMTAANGETALDVLGADAVDLILLDLSLPGMDGHEVIGRVRAWSDVPIVVLSVREQQSEKVRALEAGADDYVTKPFGVEELLARMKAVLRRAGAERESQAAVRFANVEVDLARRLVKLDGEPIHLSPTQYRLLETMVTNPGKLLTHRWLLQKVWGPGYQSESEYLRTFIRQLRQKLGDDPADPRFIVTEPGLGYRWKPEPNAVVLRRCCSAPTDEFSPPTSVDSRPGLVLADPMMNGSRFLRGSSLRGGFRGLSRMIMLSVLLTAVTAALINRPPAKASAQAAPQPNILIFLTDDQREGVEVMPQMRTWLKAGGTRYANAFATTPLCCPSRASIFTGRYVHNHGVTSNTVPQVLDQETTMQYYLDRAGYRTGILGKYMNSWRNRNPPHFDTWAIFSSAQRSYTGGEWNIQGTIQTVSEYATKFIGDRASSFLNSGSDQPWFLFLAPPNPHAPYQAQAKYQDAAVPPWNCNPAVLESDRSDKPLYVREFSASCEEGKSVRIRQLRTLMSVDDLIQRVLTKLQATGELNNTLVLFLSDNGYLWSEHGLGGKRHAYLQSIRIPMFARWTGHIAAGVVDQGLVANIDVAPTVLEAAGLTPTTPMDGRSLLSGEPRNRILAEYWRSGQWPDSAIPEWASLFRRSGHYVEYYDSDGAIVFREYYGLASDPWELSNLFSPPSGWHKQLAADRNCRGASCP